MATELLCVADIDKGVDRYRWFLLAFSLARFYMFFEFGRGGGAGRRFGGYRLLPVFASSGERLESKF